nr:hypothetical protein [Suipraeoptans intestinalis]
MAAIGLNSNLIKLVKSGGKPILLEPPAGRDHSSKSSDAVGHGNLVGKEGAGHVIHSAVQRECRRLLDISFLGFIM